MKRIYALAVVAALFIANGALWGSTSGGIAVTLKMKGVVTLTHGGKTGALKFGTVLDSADVVTTGNDGMVTIMFTDDKSLIKLKPGTTVKIAGHRDNDGNIAKRVGIEIGELFAKVEKQKGVLEVATPTSVASVKGTQFFVLYDASGNTIVTTIEGLVALKNNVTGEEYQVKVAQKCEMQADGTITFETIDPADLPGDPDPQQPSAPTKTLNIQIKDQDGKTQTIQIQVQDTQE